MVWEDSYVMKGKKLFITYQIGRIATVIILMLFVILLFFKTQILHAMNMFGLCIVIFSCLILEVFCILALNAYVRNKSMTLTNEEHLSYVSLLTHKVYKRNKNLKAYGLLLMARDALLLRKEKKAQEILESIEQDHLNAAQQKLYYLIQVVLNALFNQETHDDLVRYSVIKSKNQQYPDEDRVNKAVEEKHHDELIKMIQETRKMQHIPSYLFLLLGLMIFHIIFYIGLSSQLKTGWILRPRYALYASLISYLLYIILSGFVLYKVYQLRKKHHELSALNKAIHVIISGFLMLVVVVLCGYFGIVSLFLNDVDEKQVAHHAPNGYASWQYYEVINNNGYTSTKDYYYSQDGLFFLHASRPVRKNTQANQTTPSPQTSAQPVQNSQSGALESNQAILAVYHLIEKESLLDHMQLEYLYDAKGNIYAKIGQKEENGKTYSYTLNDNGIKSGQREIVLERQSGNEDVQLVDFYLFDGQKVTDEHKTSW